MTFENLQFTMPPPRSTSGLAESATASRRALVAERVRLMCGCYRRGEASDPTTYTVALATVLMAYDDHIVIDVTDPANGLPSRLQWLPAVAEVKAECERLQSLRSPPPVRALPAPENVVSDDERERMSRKLRALAQELGAPAPAPSEIDDADARLRSARDEREPVRFSDEIRRKYGLLDETAEVRG